VVFLVLGNTFGLEFLSIDIGAFNMSIERFWLLVLPLAYVVQRRLGKADPKPLGPADWTLLAFTLLVSVSTFMHDWRGASVYAPPVLQHLINGYLTPLVLFWLGRQMRITERELRGAYIGLVAFGAYLALTGICEALGAWSLVFPKHIASAEIGLHFGRARGPMVHAVTYGMALATSLFCGVLLWPKATRTGKFVLIALLPAALAALYFSKTRSVWLGTSAGLGLLMLTRLHGAWRPLVLGGVAAAGFVVAVTNWERIVAFDRKDNTAAQTRESVSARGSFTRVSWLMFQDRPLLGFGFGQFPLAKLPYLGDRETELRLEVIREWVHHNTFLSLLTEVGLIGLAMYVGVLVAWARGGWQRWRDETAPDWVRGQGALTLAVIAMYVAQGLFHEMSFTARDHSLLYFFGGIASGLAAMAKRHAPATVTATSPARWRWPRLAGWNVG
jgi:O-antigen ligase